MRFARLRRGLGAPAATTSDTESTPEEPETLVAALPRNAEYWADHNVTLHERFHSREQSLEALEWRNTQYQHYGDWLPHERMRDGVVLDFGCGPGHDLVTIQEFAHSRRIIGLDVSGPSIDEARERLALHPGASVHLEVVSESSPELPLDSASVDVVVSSGVLHHVFDLDAVLTELRRVLRPGGVLLAMVYNRESIWAQLYVPFIRQIRDQIDPDLSFAEAFQRSTDGPNCPRSVCFSAADFEAVVRAAGFRGGYTGAAVSLDELAWLPERINALKDRRLSSEHRAFLSALRFDDFGRPLYAGRIAGIDAFFEFEAE